MVLEISSVQGMEVKEGFCGREREMKQNRSKNEHAGHLTDEYRDMQVHKAQKIKGCPGKVKKNAKELF